MPFGGYHGAMKHLMAMLYAWPLLMRLRAPAGQDFLLQLPGGLGPLPPALVFVVTAACDAEAHVAAAMGDKQRGNTAYMAGDVDAALRHYNAGIDSLRLLTGMHLERNRQAISQAALALVMVELIPLDPSAMVGAVRSALNALMHLEIAPYQPEGRIALIRVQAAKTFKDHLTLPPATHLPGLNDTASLVGTFWSQLTAKFMEPYGGMGGILANPDAWKHPVAGMHIIPDLHPFG
jgi:hypothetical protein